MNYFTPDRLIPLQDHSDERRFLAALDDWECTLAEYRQHLKEIQQKLAAVHLLPNNLQEFLIYFNEVSLHDAHVLDMYFRECNCFRITLQPEFQPERLVVLTYSLDEPPQIRANVLPETLRSEPISWLYDEITWDGSTREGKPLLHHSILLSDGREVGLSFDSATIERPITLVPPVPTNGECA